MKLLQAQIADLEHKLIDAIKSSDVKFLEKILHDDLLFLAPNGVVVTKQMDLDSHKKGEMVVDRIMPTIENISIIDDTAVVVVVYDTEGRMLGNPIKGVFRYVRVWKKFEDGYKVVGGSCCQIVN